jgi:hypothetical protein
MALCLPNHPPPRQLSRRGAGSAPDCLGDDLTSSKPPSGFPPAFRRPEAGRVRGERTPTRPIPPFHLPGWNKRHIGSGCGKERFPFQAWASPQAMQTRVFILQYPQPQLLDLQVHVNFRGRDESHGLRQRSAMSLWWVSERLAMGQYPRATRAVSRMNRRPGRRLQVLQRKLERRPIGETL